MYSYFAIQERYAKPKEQFEVLVQVIVQAEGMYHRQQLRRPFAVLEVLHGNVHLLRLLFIVCALVVMVVVMMVMVPVRLALLR